MQKLLRRSPSGPPILSVNSSLSLPCFFSQGFYSTRNSVKMPSSASASSLHHTLHHRPENSISIAAAKNLKFMKLTSNNRPLCRCAIENDSRGIIGGSSAVPSRAWVVLKKSQWSNKSGPRALWFRTLVGNSDKGGEFVVTEAKGVDNLEYGKGAEERQVRVQRRQRNSGVGGGVVVGNPDLLTIPGVGPRNLRKLVEKGFDGVAQLKRLYKDKF